MIDVHVQCDKIISISGIVTMNLIRVLVLPNYISCVASFTFFLTKEVSEPTEQDSAVNAIAEVASTQSLEHDTEGTIQCPRGFVNS